MTVEKVMKVMSEARVEMVIDFVEEYELNMGLLEDAIKSESRALCEVWSGKASLVRKAAERAGVTDEEFQAIQKHLRISRYTMEGDISYE